jgi:hypothetical protein
MSGPVDCSLLGCVCVCVCGWCVGGFRVEEDEEDEVTKNAQI